MDSSIFLPNKDEANEEGRKCKKMEGCNFLEEIAQKNPSFADFLILPPTNGQWAPIIDLAKGRQFIAKEKTLSIPIFLEGFLSLDHYVSH